MKIETKTELLKKIIEQHQIEIKDRKEWVEQVIIWQDGVIVRYEKKEKYQ
jgi:hypothetical protein